MPTIKGTQYSGTLSTQTKMMHTPMKATMAPAVINPLPDL
jgi:hypothetical protein